ncbi:hypothetical protein DENSPDRAFT_933676 [Dentipellis sp. KUC8613]|nr:hypothetical protein DENSPDRAFT_933676 [Dentipellis sp. KUC8613]
MLRGILATVATNCGPSPLCSNDPRHCATPQFCSQRLSTPCISTTRTSSLRTAIPTSNFLLDLLFLKLPFEHRRKATRMFASRTLNVPAMPASPQNKSPIARLSRDVLQYIFEVGTWDTREMDDSKAFPWLVSHVSHDWRHLALATPTLWTLITMEDNLESPNYFRDRHNLTRSQKCDLIVYIDFRIPGWEYMIDGGPHPFTENIVQRLFWVLSEHMQRVRSFTLLSDTDYPVRLAHLLFQHQPSTRLQHFEIERRPHSLSLGLGDPPMDVEAPAALNTHSACALKSLSLTGTHLDWTQFSFTNLSRLTISHLPISIRPSIEVLYSAIGQCANCLEYLKIDCATPATETAGGDVWDSSRSILLPCVQVLVLGYAYPAEVVLLAKFLSCPALKKFTVCGTGRALTTADHRARSLVDGSMVLEALLQGNGIASMGSVRELAIEGLQLPESPVLALNFLNSFPNLESLVLHDASPTLLAALAITLSQFNSRQDPEPLRARNLPCRKLRELRLIDMDVEAINVTLETRRSTLQSLNIAGQYGRLGSISVYSKAFQDEHTCQVAKTALLSHADTVVLGEHYQPKPYRHDYAAWEIPQYYDRADNNVTDDGDPPTIDEQPLPALTGALA